VTTPTNIGPKLIEWGESLERAQDHEELSRRAAELKQSYADGILSEAEYRVLCGIGKRHREKLNGEGK